MTHLSNVKKEFFVILLLVSFLPVKAQVMWNLKGGIMQRSYYDEYTIGWDESYRDKRIDWMAGLELEIPLNSKLNLETGLRYKNHYSLVAPDIDSWNDGYYYNWNYREATSHIELPLRLTYKQPLGKYFSLHAGLGPYASYAFGDDFGEEWHNNLQVGLEPSVVINWACLSLGFTYNIPCFYKGFKDENSPAMMATLGIRFKSKAWKYIGAGLLAVATVGAGVAAAWPTNDGSSYSSSSYNSASYDNNNSSSHSSSSRSSSSASSSNKYNLSEEHSYNTDKQTYHSYDGMLSKHFYGGTSGAATASDVRQWQQAMKKIRTKWENKGKSFPKFDNETKSTSGCASSSHTHK